MTEQVSLWTRKTGHTSFASPGEEGVEVAAAGSPSPQGSQRRQPASDSLASQDLMGVTRESSRTHLSVEGLILAQRAWCVFRHRAQGWWPKPSFRLWVLCRLTENKLGPREGRVLFKISLWQGCLLGHCYLGPFINSFNKYLLSTYYVSGIVLGIESTS